MDKYHSGVSKENILGLEPHREVSVVNLTVTTPHFEVPLPGVGSPFSQGSIPKPPGSAI